MPASSPPTVAAADEPRPRASGIVVVHLDAPADAVGEGAAGRPHGRLDPADEPVLAILGELALALTVDGQLDLAATPAADLDLHLVGEGERDAQAVVAGAEVGRRSRAPPP